MPALSVRGLSNDIYGGLKRLARRSHRSLQEQVKIILEKEVALAEGAQASPWRWRERLKNRPWGDVVADVRGERTR